MWMTMLQEDYRVTLDAFQGPLDLLLYLIRREEVDITDIPIARITDQYLSFLRGIDDIDVELAGEFLVMASALIELKSRMLVPMPEDEGEPDGTPDERTARAVGDPRDDLVRQLLAYQRFRVAAEQLETRRDVFSRRFALRGTRVTLPDDADREIELEDAHAMDLADAYQRIVASIDFARLGQHVVEIDDTPLALHQEDLLDRLGRTSDGRMTLQSAFGGLDGMRRVGLFMAALELVRLRRITVVQDDIDQEIELIVRQEDEETLHIASDDIETAHSGGDHGRGV